MGARLRQPPTARSGSASSARKMARGARRSDVEVVLHEELRRQKKAEAQRARPRTRSQARKITRGGKLDAPKTAIAKRRTARPRRRARAAVDVFQVQISNLDEKVRLADVKRMVTDYQCEMERVRLGVCKRGMYNSAVIDFKSMKVAMQFIKMFDHVRLNNVPLCVSLLTVVQGAALPMPPPPPPPPPDFPPPPYYDGGGSSDASYANMADVSR